MAGLGTVGRSGRGRCRGVDTIAPGPAVGSFNLYATRPRQYRATDLETGHILAAHLSMHLARTKTEEQLRRAMETRTVIGQAQGMIMQRYGVTADTAFAVDRHRPHWGS